LCGTQQALQARRQWDTREAGAHQLRSAAEMGDENQRCVTSSHDTRYCTWRGEVHACVKYRYMHTCVLKVHAAADQAALAETNRKPELIS
jgi:hypothetical protein